MKYYWLYVPDEDEAGCVAPGIDANDALREAAKLGWYPDAKAEVQWHELGAGGTLTVPNYPFRDEDECDDFCSHHSEECDGYCDHVGHRNKCLNDAEYEARCQKYDNA